MGEKKGKDQITKKILCNLCCTAEPTHQFCHTLFEKTSMGSREQEASNRTLAKYSKSEGLFFRGRNWGRKAALIIESSITKTAQWKKEAKEATQGEAWKQSRACTLD